MTGWDEERYDDLIAELRAQIKALQATLREQEKRQKELVAALEAFAVAFREPDGGPYFKLRAIAESYGIYADDLGRDRILLRIAQAALAVHVEEKPSREAS